MINKLSRRTFFSSSLGAAAALTLPSATRAETAHSAAADMGERSAPPSITDTNVHLFDWPFRKLKYGDTTDLVAKLKKHRVAQAWAGSYEALFHKDIHGVNSRLAEECRRGGQGVLLPFGTVNLAWPDWEEDLRRCHEQHKMKGVRIYPIYQTIDLAHPDFRKFVKMASDKKLLIQIVGDMEDTRHHHPIVGVRELDLDPLADIAREVPNARIQLVYWNHRVPKGLLSKLITGTNVMFDTSRVEGAGEVGRLIEGRSWSGSDVAIPVERFVFGSHAPYFPLETNIIKLFESPLTENQMVAIMNGNARRLITA